MRRCSSGRLEQHGHDPHGLGGQVGDRALLRPLDQRARLVAERQRRGLRPVEPDLGRAQTVEGPERPPLDPGRRRVDQEDAGTVGRGRGDHQPVGRVAMDDVGLHATQAPGLAVALGADLRGRRARPGAGLVGGPGQEHPPRRDLGNQLGPRRRVRAEPKRRPGQRRGREIGLGREPSAQRLGDHQGLHRPAAQAAVGFREGRGEQAEVGEGRPQLAAPALRRRSRPAPGLEVAAVGQEPLQRLLQHRLLGGELEVHRPSTPDAMMFFCTSLAPP